MLQPPSIPLACTVDVNGVRRSARRLPRLSCSLTRLDAQSGRISAYPSGRHYCPSHPHLDVGANDAEVGGREWATVLTRPSVIGVTSTSRATCAAHTELDQLGGAGPVPNAASTIGDATAGPADQYRSCAPGSATKAATRHTCCRIRLRVATSGSLPHASATPAGDRAVVVCSRSSTSHRTSRTTWRYRADDLRSGTPDTARVGTRPALRLPPVPSSPDDSPPTAMATGAAHVSHVARSRQPRIRRCPAHRRSSRTPDVGDRS